MNEEQKETMNRPDVNLQVGKPNNRQDNDNGTETVANQEE
jgi:hypothetical protein